MDMTSARTARADSAIAGRAATRNVPALGLAPRHASGREPALWHPPPSSAIAGAVAVPAAQTARRRSSQARQPSSSTTTDVANIPAVHQNSGGRPKHASVQQARRRTCPIRQPAQQRCSSHMRQPAQPHGTSHMRQPAQPHGTSQTRQPSAARRLSGCASTAGPILDTPAVLSATRTPEPCQPFARRASLGLKVVPGAGHPLVGPRGCATRPAARRRGPHRVCLAFGGTTARAAQSAPGARRHDSANPEGVPGARRHEGRALQVGQPFSATRVGIPDMPSELGAA
jgi:hypothetical protein